MGEGKVKRYLLYAIGEILLVMIGILLALQVNNWNQNRVNHSKESKALNDLSKEFELNEQRIKEKQNARIALSPSLDKYISAIAKGEADYHSFKEFHASEFMFGMTNPSRGVIDALISSGEISLVSNDSLKYYLADWKNQMENLYENEQILWNAGLALIGCSTDKIPDPRHNWTDWNNDQLKSASTELISDVAYRNYLTGFEGCNKIVIEECKAALGVLDKISNLLQEEIDANK